MKRTEKSSYKSLSIHESIHDELTSYGKKNETYDQILRKILKVYKKYKDVYEKETNKKNSGDGKVKQQV